jgi:hypothetical protein
MAQFGRQPMSVFLDEAVEMAPDGKLPTDALVAAYLGYCQEKAVAPGGGQRPGDQLGTTEALAQWGDGFSKGSHDNYYLGVRLKVAQGPSTILEKEREVSLSVQRK